ncbi:MAG TPA: addiction module antidote protein [Candidatus Acidoferrales bacterium]|nr:addiction module antidote protein [Candidatus Acidoferrales bacterium]
MNARTSRSHDEATVESFRKDPEFAAAYLDAILEDGDEGELLQALQRIAKAFGGVGEIANKADLHAKTLYRTLSSQGNPEMKTLVAVLRAMGLRLSVRPLEDADRRMA